MSYGTIQPEVFTRRKFGQFATHSCWRKFDYRKSGNFCCKNINIFIDHGCYENQSYENSCALLTLTWYGVIPINIFQHDNLSHESFITQKFPDLWYTDGMATFTALVKMVAGLGKIFRPYGTSWKYTYTHSMIAKI